MAEGTALFKAADYLGALGKYKAALEAEGADAEKLHRNLGMVYLKLGLPHDALDSCNACLKLCPNDPKSRYRSAQALIEMDNHVAAWGYMQVMCDDLMYEEKDGKQTVSKDWKKMLEQCVKGLRCVTLHPDLRLKEFGEDGQYGLVSCTDLEQGTVLLQEARYCRNRDQEEKEGGLKSSVDSILKITQEGGLMKYAREMRGMHPRFSSHAPEELWEKTKELARAGSKEGTEDDTISAIALVSLQYNFNRFEDSLYRTCAFFTHSCAPNCDRSVLINNDMNIVTLEKIKAGTPLTVNYLPFEALLSGVSVRQCLVRGRYGKACTCPRCAEDWGKPAEENTKDGYQCYGAVGEMVKCTAMECKGYVHFPTIEDPEGVSGPCSVCGAKVDRKAIEHFYNLMRGGIRAFLPSLFLSSSEELPEIDNKLNCVQAWAALRLLYDSGLHFLHPQHHLLRFVYYLQMKVSKPMFQMEYNRAFGEQNHQFKKPEDVAKFSEALKDANIISTAVEVMDRLTLPMEKDSNLAGPLAPFFNPIAEGHAGIADFLSVFLSTREVAPGYDSLKAVEEATRARLKYCPVKIRNSVQAILNDLKNPKPTSDPQMDKQQAMMEMLAKMQAQNPNKE